MVAKACLPEGEPMSARHLACALAVLLPLTPLAASSQNAPPAAAYRPGLGDLMTMTVQPRHLKLGVAGQERNWAYVGYEVHELEEAFERIERLVPKWRNVDIPNLIASTVKQPIEALEKAAKAQEPSSFDDAYAKLTAACNACHQSANVGMIVVQVPKTSPFSNQDFRPQKP
jgi:hypothetical protein